jgi:selenocysteine lyase/cysteine desulfurase
MVAQMATVRLRRPSPELAQRLFTRHRVEIPVGGPEKDLLRLSVAGYTTHDEIDRLLAALARELDAEYGQRDK